jgi:hypothetical protein
VQHLRRRMCYELNFASSFLITENDRIDGTPGRARFAAKLSREVQATTGALVRPEARLAEICGWSSGRGP